MSNQELYDTNAITAVILAGGRGSRMGGVDKGLQLFRGQPLVTHAMQRLSAQQRNAPISILINANRNVEQYAGMGATVVVDSLQDFQGPLAGFLAALDACSTPYLLTVPCDSPLFPLDLAQRMSDALLRSDAQIAVAMAPEHVAGGATVLRSQPVFCLMRTEVRESLRLFLESGGRKV
ncbi:MAG: molybdenum cofactor guanylyltransferase, partial [Rhodoferax sp.]|nr:molybdenum cofactor guanylyltransferase [Rhodoferax sp.]